MKVISDRRGLVVCLWRYEIGTGAVWRLHTGDFTVRMRFYNGFEVAYGALGFCLCRLNIV